MIQVAYTNIQSKITIDGVLSDPFTLTRRVHQGCPLSTLLYIIAAKMLAVFIYADTRIKQVQIGDHEMDILNLGDDTTIFWRDINCLIRIQLILKLYEKAFSSKTNFSKIHALWASTYRFRIDKPGQMVWSQFSIKILGVHFVNFVLDNNNWDLINDKSTKKIIFKTDCDSLWEGKINRKPKPVIKTMAHRSNIYYSKIYQKGKWKKNIQFRLTRQKKNKTSHAPSLALHLEGWARYFRHRCSIKLCKKVNGFKVYYTPSMLSGKLWCWVDLT